MSVTHDFECVAHGHFEARVRSGVVPRCPKGCSKSLVRLVHLKAPGTVSARTRTGDRLLREAAEMQGLSDVSTSPSRSGGSVAARNQAKVRGPRNRPDLQYSDAAAAQSGGLAKFLGAMTHRANELTKAGFGHPYEPTEWRKDDKTGTVSHVGAKEPIAKIPLGSTGVSIDRVKEVPK